MAKKDLKRGRTAAHKGVKSKNQVPHGSPQRESGGASESEARRLDREIIKLASRRALLTLKLIQGHPHPQKLLFAPIWDEHLTELMEKYPDTKAAKEAKEMLEKLK